MHFADKNLKWGLVGSRVYEIGRINIVLFGSIGIAKPFVFRDCSNMPNGGPKWMMASFIRWYLKYLKSEIMSAAVNFVLFIIFKPV